MGLPISHSTCVVGKQSAGVHSILLAVKKEKPGQKKGSTSHPLLDIFSRCLCRSDALDKLLSVLCEPESTPESRDRVRQ